MGFSRQEYWSGLPCPSPGDLPDPWNDPVSLTSPALAGGFFTHQLSQKNKTSYSNNSLLRKVTTPESKVIFCM